MSVDSQPIPKIKLNDLSGKGRLGYKNTQNYYKNIPTTDGYRYGDSIKDRKGKFNTSIDIGASMISLKKQQRYAPTKGGKVKYSSCSFRNPQTHSSHLAMRRPSSSIEADKARFPKSHTRRKSSRRNKSICTNRRKQSSLRGKSPKIKDFSLRREDQIHAIESAKNKSLECDFQSSNLFKNSLRSKQGIMTINENGQRNQADLSRSFRDKEPQYNSRCYSSCNPTAQSNRYSGRFQRDPFYTNARSSTHA